jgi:hypothetical protein
MAKKRCYHCGESVEIKKLLPLVEIEADIYEYEKEYKKAKRKKNNEQNNKDKIRNSRKSDD